MYLWRWGKWAGGEDGQELVEFSPCATASCESREFATPPGRISGPQGNRRMAPPQASPDPPWPVSLVWHLLVWPVLYTVHTCGWDQASEGQGYQCNYCGSIWNNHCRKRSCPWDTRHGGLCQTSGAYPAPAQIPGRWFCPCLPEDPLLSCWSSRWSASLAISP